MTKLNKSQISLLDDFAYDNDFRFYESYSGRCMFEKKCVGFVVDEKTESSYLVEKLCDFLNKSNEPELATIFYDTNKSWDSMGMGYIIYFPSISEEA